MICYKAPSRQRWSGSKRPFDDGVFCQAVSTQEAIKRKIAPQHSNSRDVLRASSSLQCRNSLPHLKDEVADEQASGKCVLGKQAKLLGKECEPANQQRCAKDQNEGWQDASDTPCVEQRDVDFAGGLLHNQDPSYQISADDKENVHPNKAGRKHFRKGVKRHYGNHRDSSQTINVRPVIKNLSLYVHETTETLTVEQNHLERFTSCAKI